MKNLKMLNHIMAQQQKWTELKRKLSKHLRGTRVNPQQFMILAKLYTSNERLRPSDISEYFGIERATVSRSISSLMDADLVSYVYNEKDRREVFVSLTKLQRDRVEGLFNGFQA